MNFKQHWILYVVMKTVSYSTILYADSHFSKFLKNYYFLNRGKMCPKRDLTCLIKIHLKMLSKQVSLEKEKLILYCKVPQCGFFFF